MGGFSKDSPDTDPGGRSPDRPAVVADRYQVTGILGRGAHGVVFEAEDRVRGDRVALKRLEPVDDAEWQRVHNELATLRALRLPGIAHLRDEGLADGSPYVVMDRVAGTAFPGCPTPASWARIRETTRLLLETLHAVHAEGFVHGDLKPANVLVDEAGRPWLVDFGLARSAHLPVAEADGDLVGTAAYLAPEQITGTHDIDARSDLYAVGVMLHEALAGVPPFEGPSPEATLRAKLLRAAPSIPPTEDAIPASVAETVAQLLAADPADRPGSAADALAGLIGEDDTPLRLPHLGSDETVRLLAETARDGRSSRIHAPPGGGKSTTLRLLSTQLELADVETLLLGASDDPFGSLAPLFEAARGTPVEGDVGRAIAGAEKLVRRFLRRGGVLLVDDAERVDRWSAGCLDRQRAAGSIIEAFGTARPDAVPLPALRRTQLRKLFAGPERVLHLRHDAADLLQARSSGHPGRVVAELRQWLATGMAERLAGEPPLFRLTPRGRAELDETPRVTITGDAQPVLRQLNDALDDLLAWVVLADPDATPALLQQVSGVPAGELLFQITELSQIGAVTFARDGTLRPLVPSRALQSWSPARRREAHRDLTELLEPESPSRLVHAIACGHDAVVVSEATLRAQRACIRGRYTAAWRTVRRALVAVARTDETSREASALRVLLARVALDSGDNGRLTRARHELSRNPSDAPAMDLVDAALALRRGDQMKARTLLEAVELDAGPLARFCAGLRIGANWKGRPGALEAACADAVTWAATAGRTGRAWAAQWLGRVAWEHHDPDQAAEHFEDAARLHTGAAVRLEALVAAARVRLATGAWHEARARAREAVAIARLLRNHAAELDAELCLRSAGWLEGRRAGADEQLLAVLEWLPVGDHHGVAWLVESLHAHRAGDHEQSLRLVRAARLAWRGRSQPAGVITPFSAEPALVAGREPRGALPVIAPTVRGLYVPD